MARLVHEGGSHLSAPWVFMEGGKQADELQMEHGVNNATSHLVGVGQFGSGGKNSIHRGTGLFTFCYQGLHELLSNKTKAGTENNQMAV